MQKIIELCTINSINFKKTKRNIACPGRQARDYNSVIGKAKVNRVITLISIFAIVFCGCSIRFKDATPTSSTITVPVGRQNTKK